MHKTFFTADQHFNHANIIKYCDRPFRTVDEMNRVMIERWNSAVAEEDLVYFLGDFGFFRSVEEASELIHALHGDIIPIFGNHDKKEVRKADWCVTNQNQQILEINAELEGSDPAAIDSIPVVMCHYPLASWNKSFHGSLMLHGHTHGTVPSIPKRMDVGVDCWNFTPVTLEDILKKLFHQFGN